MTPDVTVIIAAWNVERYIERAVRSALDQQGVTVEVIVIDDCSPDSTFETAKAINDPRLTCLRMPRNGGPGAARNAGIAAAKGQWIAVLDGDDAFTPGRLARLLTRARETGADIVVDNQTVVGEKDGSTAPMFPPARFARLKTLDLATFIRGRITLCEGPYTLGYLKPVISTAFLKRAALSYPEDIRIGEDYLIMAEALAVSARCAVEPEPGYLYTARAGSISHRLRPDDVERMLEGDARFLSRHRLTGAAARAQRWRTFLLKETHAYTRMVEALKRGSIAGTLRAAALCPTAPRHLWEPVWVRLRRKEKS